MTSRSGLPARVTPLVGRVDELAELEDLVGRERIVTLAGSGGCGKTRLALELVHRIGPRLPGGVDWVELADCADHGGVLAAVSAALDAVERPGEDPMDAVLRALRTPGERLLVLDNAEHVVSAVAEVMAALGSSSDLVHVSVLCTSREPVGVPGEVVWRVPSLSMPPERPGATGAAEASAFEAVQLFVERAVRARRGFVLTDANASAVVQICRRLDGVPLAIELAAARVRSMPPARIAAELDDRFRLLAGGPRTQVPRQRTLYASVAWSEALLDDGDRRVFRRLGVFAGGFTVEAAEAVVGAFDDVDAYAVADAVWRLVDKSLVQFDEGRDRYLLLDTIRSFAVQRLFDFDETARARDAHASWCAGWLASASSDRGLADANAWWASRLEIVGRVDPEWPNCAAALGWARPGSALALRLVAGLGDYWALRQRAGDSARYGMPTLVAADPDDPGWLPAVVALQTVRTNAADATFATLRQRAIERADERGDRASAVRLEVGQHIAGLMLVGPRPDLLDAVDRIRAEATALGEWFSVWNAAQSPAVILCLAGRHAEATARIAGLTGARALLIRAVAAQARGDFDGADALLGDARAKLELRLGAVLDRMLAAFAVAGSALARADRALLRPAGADERARDALPRPFLFAFEMLRGVDELLDGRYAQARATFAATAPGLFTEWHAASILAPIELSLGQRDDARATARRLAAATAAVDAPLFTACSDLVLAECEWPDDPVAALDLAHRSLAAAVSCELWPNVVDALEAIGALLASVGRAREAGPILGAAEEARRTMSYRHRYAHRAAYVAEAGDAVGDDRRREGAGLSLVEAAALATRMRGERVRPAFGWDSLTPTERRVVDHVVAGLTNPRIAEALLMSRATVKTHLVHIYAKVGVATRAELAALAARRGEA